MKIERVLFCSILALITFSVALSIFACATNAQTDFKQVSIKLLQADQVIRQSAGTQQTYTVLVKNDGEDTLDRVYLKISFLPSSWYELGNNIRMKPGTTAELPYILKIPSDGVGEVKFKVTVEAVRGFGVVDSESVDVQLASLAGATTTKTTATAETTVPTTKSATTETGGENATNTSELVTKKSFSLMDILKDIFWNFLGWKWNALFIGLAIALFIVLVIAAYKLVVV